MARVKPQRQGIHIDMTPMSDLAWLLLTFFILTTEFRPPDILNIDTPSSISSKEMKDVGTMKISIPENGKYYFSMEEEKYRVPLLNAMGEKYNISFNAKEQNEFKKISEFGVPIQQLKQYLSFTESQREKLEKSGGIPGIPSDSLSPQIVEWVFEARKLAEQNNDSLELKIKGDQNVKYERIKNLLDRLQDRNLNKFKLITVYNAGK